MSEYQEEVLTNLLGLQAELRGDEREPHDEHSAEGSPEGSPKAALADTEGADGHDSQETISVTEEDVTVSLSSRASSMGVSERLAALNERLAQLEFNLMSVTKRIERMEPDPEVVSSGNTDSDVDARWRSFIDLQKIVADRLDQR